MSLQNVPFFEYPRLWSDDRKEFLSIIDSVSSTGGFILLIQAIHWQSLNNFSNNLS
jgi:hypothetical protein